MCVLCAGMMGSELFDVAAQQTLWLDFAQFRKVRSLRLRTRHSVVHARCVGVAAEQCGLSPTAVPLHAC